MMFRREIPRTNTKDQDLFILARLVSRGFFFFHIVNDKTSQRVSGARGVCIVLREGQARRMRSLSGRWILIPII
jgi:hypothetical protein